jgi:hypothetical protein
MSHSTIFTLRNFNPPQVFFQAFFIQDVFTLFLTATCPEPLIAKSLAYLVKKQDFPHNTEHTE